jgi:hypothetical protein
MTHNYSRCTDDNKDKEYTLTVDDRRKLREVGIQTSHEQPAWQTIEPSRGNYNFGYLDDILNTNRQADLKTLFYVSGWRVPYWIPNEWRAKTADGIYEREMLSMWNEEAQQYSDNYYQMLYDKYADPDILWIFGEYQGGEGAYPPTWCLYDDAAIADYKSKYGSTAMPDPHRKETMDWFGNKIIDHFVRKSTILQPRYKEVWNMQQYLMDTWTKAFGNFAHLDTLKKYRELWPDGNIVLLQATYYDDAHKADNVLFVDMLRDVTGCEVIVEAMYCKGLPTTTPKAIAQGFRGQIIRPCNEPGCTSLEQWMVDAIRDSHNLWMESRG